MSRNRTAASLPCRGLFEEKGQMTVELAVAFPVMIAVAVISMNALLFFSECAAFDRLACQAVRVNAAAPAYGVGPSQTAGLVQQELEGSFDRSYLGVSVAAVQVGFDYTEYSATLEFAPTLFGMGLKDSVFGVSLPHLRHTVSYVVDPYRPGVII